MLTIEPFIFEGIDDERWILKLDDHVLGVWHSEADAIIGKKAVEAVLKLTL